MGKVRKVVLGDQDQEKETKRKAEARRQTKASKKAKVEGVGLKGGERTVAMEGGELKPEFKKLVEEVEGGESADHSSQITDKKKKKNVKAKTRSKRYQELRKLVDKTKLYALKEAISLTKQTSNTKFSGTIELHINLNPLSLGDKKDYRTGVSLPHGTGKEIRVAIADDKILAEIENGKITFDVLVAHPSMMPKLAKVAKTLGPKGLMPNPKTGTVTPDPEKRAKELSSGAVNIKTEPNNPIIHMPIGKVTFTDKQVEENVTAVLSTIGHNKISRVTLSSTMGPGVKVEI
jgi:large subunit ribosomal protein L1